MTDTELKPCPFCGGPGKITKHPDAELMGRMYTGICDHCGVSPHGWFASVDEAANAWNTRAIIADRESRASEPGAPDGETRELVERLSYDTEWRDPHTSERRVTRRSTLELEAADAITRLERERDEARLHRDYYRWRAEAADAELAKVRGKVIEVKALEWTQKAPPAHDYEPFSYWAAGIGGYYCAEPDGTLWLAHDAFEWAKFGNQAEAKAAAQADYEKRIRSALEGGV